MMSVDGFFAGPNRELDWHLVDSGFNDFAIEQLNSAEKLIFGRITYELMASYWTTKEAITNDPIVAEKMNSLPKFVFSKTLDKVQLIQLNLIDEYRLMVSPVILGKGIPLFGNINGRKSLTLTRTISFKSGNMLLQYEPK